jgi:hypothetical protein
MAAPSAGCAVSAGRLQAIADALSATITIKGFQNLFNMIISPV